MDAVVSSRAVLNTLTEPELALVRETDRSALAGLDEDGLVALHSRVRRARDKYVGMYRREASGRVREVGGRGKARPKNQRNAQKAEVFEDALARVSRSLATAARRSATELRAERLANARRDRVGSPPRVSQPRTRAARTTSDQRADRRPTGAALDKRRASTQAANSRRQARKDA